MSGPLQTGLLDDWLSGNWFDALLEPYYGLLGEAGFALIIVVPMSLGLYLRSGSIFVPAVVLVMFAGLMIGGLPTSAAIALYLAVAVAMAAGLRRVMVGR